MLLLILLMLCHYIGDYTHLSTSYMLNAKRIGYPLFPIFLHSLVHCLLMFIVMVFFADFYISILLALFQLFSHFIIDVLKGRMNVWFPVVSNPINKSHWYIFGLDQLLHHLVIVIIYYLINLLN